MSDEQRKVVLQRRTFIPEDGGPGDILDAWPVQIKTIHPHLIIRATAQQYFKAIDPIWIVGLTHEGKALKYASGQDVVFPNLSGVAAMETVERLNEEIKSGLFDNQIELLKGQMS